MRTTRTVLLPLLATVCAAALAGCSSASPQGGGSSQAASAPAASPASAAAPASSAPSSAAPAPAAVSGPVPKPCTVISASAVGAILGKTVTSMDPAVKSKNVDASCVYLSGGSTAFIVVAKRADASELDATAAKAAKQGEKGTAVSGYGEKAEEFNANKDHGAVILVFDKGVLFTVLAEKAPIEQAEQLAVLYDRAL